MAISRRSLLAWPPLAALLLRTHPPRLTENGELDTEDLLGPVKVEIANRRPGEVLRWLVAQRGAGAIVYPSPWNSAATAVETDVNRER